MGIEPRRPFIDQGVREVFLRAGSRIGDPEDDRELAEDLILLRERRLSLEKRRLAGGKVFVAVLGAIATALVGLGIQMVLSGKAHIP